MATWSGKVSQSSDDGTQVANSAESPGNINNITATEPTWSSAATEAKPAMIAFVFKNVLIPQGATVTKVELELFAKSSVENYTFNWYSFEELPTVPTFTGAANDIRSRKWFPKGPEAFTKTFTTGAYNLITSTVGEGAHAANQINQTVKSAEWKEGNAIGMMLLSTKASNLKIAMYDFEAGAKAAKIVVTYTPPEAAAGNPVSMLV